MSKGKLFVLRACPLEEANYVNRPAIQRIHRAAGQYEHVTILKWHPLPALDASFHVLHIQTPVR